MPTTQVINEQNIEIECVNNEGKAIDLCLHNFFIPDQIIANQLN